MGALGTQVRVGVRLELPGGSAARAALAALPAWGMAAERVGLDLVWLPEHPGGAGGALPAALVAGAALAAVTRRLRIAAGPLALPLLHPLRLAEDAATLDVLSEGRLELGVGLGSDVEPLAQFGIAPGARRSRFEEAIALLQAAFAGGALGFAGEHFRVAGGELAPQPFQPGGPPLWVAAEAAAAQRRAAHLGAGLLLRAGASGAAYAAEAAALGGGRVAWLLDDPVPARAALAPPAGVGVDWLLRRRVEPGRDPLQVLGDAQRSLETLRGGSGIRTPALAYTAADPHPAAPGDPQPKGEPR